MWDYTAVNGAVAVLKQQYIVLFGGIGDNLDNNFGIYSLHDAEFTKSKVQHPIKRAKGICTINDPNRDELSVLFE